MAACVHGVTLASTTDGTSFTTGSFTPAASNLLVAFVIATGTVAAGSMSDSQGLGWTKIASVTKNAGADTEYLFVANALAAASAMTVTFDCTGDSATGAIIHVCRVSAMTRTGSSAVRQSKTTSGAGGGNIDSPIFDAACLTGNPTLEGGSTADTSMVPPASWTERADSTYATPTTQHSYHTRDSGFTGTDINWADGTGTAYAVIAVELDTSAAGGGGAAPRELGTLGVGN